MIKILLFVFFILLTSIAHSEPMTADEYINKSIQYQTALNDYEKAKINLEIQKKELKKASEPEIRYHSGYDPSKGYITSGVSVSGNITDIFLNTSTYREKIKLAQIEVNQKKANLDDLKRKLTQEYHTKISEIQRLKNQIINLHSQLQLKAAQLKIIQHRFDEGIVTRDELLKINSEILDVKNNIDTTEDNLKIKEEELER